MQTGVQALCAAVVEATSKPINHLENDVNVLERERQQDAEADAMVRTAKYLHDEFISAARLGTMGAKALFAPMVRDFLTARHAGEPAPKRHQFVGDVFTSTLPDSEQDALLGMLCRMAYSATPQAVLAQDARTLIESMAWRFAAGNAA